jgi:hypothetical protein
MYAFALGKREIVYYDIYNKSIKEILVETRKLKVKKSHILPREISTSSQNFALDFNVTILPLHPTSSKLAGNVRP